ncbi:hypothetical protein [Umezawaea sp.]|uniref:hypothetical protein n=1 Tax=Umezawaea sp. TaxID=1955258 RepID=UPI002ED11386
MARWVWPTAAGVVTSATGVLVNVATDLMTEPWAWVGVVALTGVGVGVAMKVRSAPAAVEAGTESDGVRNSVLGSVGHVVQVGTIGGSYVDRSVTQTATAGDRSTIIQAGRDVRSE